MIVTNDIVLEKVTPFLGQDLISSETPFDLLTITIAKDRIIDILKYLKTDVSLNFIFLTDITAVHYPNQIGSELCVVYHLHNLEQNIRVRIKAFLDIANPEIESATAVFRSANWMERETYDFYGVIFKNHPNLVRILNIEEMDYFPMRKEYPLEDGTRTDKNDSMFGR
jgi:NADH-quinone oxidoreductase subunit C